MVSCAFESAAWAGPVSAAVRAGTVAARWARVVPTVLAGTAGTAPAGTAEACSARWDAGRPA